MNPKTQTEFCADCVEPSDDKWVYMVKLHLQDATGEIDVGLFDKDAETFFEVRSGVVHQPSQPWIPVRNYFS